LRRLGVLVGGDIVLNDLSTRIVQTAAHQEEEDRTGLSKDALKPVPIRLLTRDDVRGSILQ
jgi:hypothetical protein